MILLSNTVAQTLAPGAALAFDNVIRRTDSSVSHRSGSTASVLRSSCGSYDISFHGNVSGAAAGTPVQLSIQLGGATLPETTMISTPGTADTFNNVSAETTVGCSGFAEAVTVVNTGTEAITVGANAVLSIEHHC